MSIRDVSRDRDNVTENGFTLRARVSQKEMEGSDIWGNIWSKRQGRLLRIVVDRFIARANIAHFEDLLAKETDPEKLRVIGSLLAAERRKLEIAEHQSDAKPSNPDEPSGKPKPG